MNQQNLNQFLAAARQYFFGMTPAQSAMSNTACRRGN